jgi:hypothetical protein
MPRKYELPHPGGMSRWSVSGAEASMLEARRITAIDERDVEPLLEAARPLQDIGTKAPDESHCSVPTQLLRDLQRALRAFEVEEGTGG